MHEFIRIHRQRLNAAFGLDLRYAPSYTGMWLILRGVNQTGFLKHGKAS